MLLFLVIKIKVVDMTIKTITRNGENFGNFRGESSNQSVEGKMERNLYRGLALPPGAHNLRYSCR